ncbi:MAG: chromate efflux transporter [Verrucomicrobia bacterium]|nr:MAG: chromate efflux transporter [Verrucomicrobiota bacterium]
MARPESPLRAASADQPNVPLQSYGKLFLRFLRFGSLAWGGPVAQIDMIRQELVTEEKWISPAHFKRLLAIYQVLPGPEAHELCVHFGMLARGRVGGLLAGLGFMLPGFVLMFLLSWLYLSVNLAETPFQAVFLGIQPAVIALIVRACHRIGGHCLTHAPLWVIGGLAALGEALSVSFYITLPLAGLAYVVASRRRWFGAAAIGCIFALAAWQSSPLQGGGEPLAPTSTSVAEVAAVAPAQVSAPTLFGSGLRAGLLTFGGAYTAIPFLREDAVERGQWMSEREFLDGVALSGTLPAPLIIFSTFIGYSSGGPLGALAITAGVFLPAFLFSILFFRHLEKIVHHPTLHSFLEGVTAGVVGLIAVTTVSLGLAAIPDLKAGLIFVIALLAVYRWRNRFAVPGIVAGAGLLGWFLFA